jgi:hypothetical protein
MPRNPDRVVSADRLPEQEHEDLRALLERSETADLFDSAACQRIGKLISRAVFNPAKPGW